MGMFDYICCEVPLPDGWAADELQTKDFDCEMVTHVITAAGRLLLDQGHWEGVPKEERPYPDADDWRSLFGSIRRVPKMVDANFHGLVDFGGLEVLRYEPDGRYGPKGRPIYKSHDYIAKFTDGQLVEIIAESTDAFAEEAQGMEARQGGDAQAAPSIDESPVGEADAPNAPSLASLDKEGADNA